jgi:hypothetical protein
MYSRGLGLCVVGRFEDHDGFDGVMLGLRGSSYHFEFTHSRTHPVVPAPTPEDLLVFYVPTAAEWQTACASMSSCSKRSGAMSRSLEPMRLNHRAPLEAQRRFSLQIGPHRSVKSERRR